MSSIQTYQTWGNARRNFRLTKVKILQESGSTSSTKGCTITLDDRGTDICTKYKRPLQTRTAFPKLNKARQGSYLRKTQDHTCNSAISCSLCVSAVTVSGSFSLLILCLTGDYLHHSKLTPGQTQTGGPLNALSQDGNPIWSQYWTPDKMLNVRYSRSSIR